MCPTTEIYCVHVCGVGVFFVQDDKMLVQSREAHVLGTLNLRNWW